MDEEVFQTYYNPHLHFAQSGSRVNYSKGGATVDFSHLRAIETTGYINHSPYPKEEPVFIPRPAMIPVDEWITVTRRKG